MLSGKILSSLLDYLIGENLFLLLLGTLLSSFSLTLLIDEKKGDYSNIATTQYSPAGRLREFTGTLIDFGGVENHSYRCSYTSFPTRSLIPTRAS